jgi:hypothetical protein
VTLLVFSLASIVASGFLIAQNRRG